MIVKIMNIMTIAMIVMITRTITSMIAVTVNCHQKLNWEIKTWKPNSRLEAIFCLYFCHWPTIHSSQGKNSMHLKKWLLDLVAFGEDRSSSFDSLDDFDSLNHDDNDDKKDSPSSF